jgi:hypothetical protein
MTKTTTETISFDLFGECGVEITEFISNKGEKAYAVYWNDYMVNEWTEYFPTLSIALARVAVLAEAVEGGETYANNALEFTFDASKFIAKQL